MLSLDSFTSLKPLITMKPSKDKKRHFSKTKQSFDRTTCSSDRRQEWESLGNYLDPSVFWGGKPI